MTNKLAALISLIFSPFLVPIAGTLVAVSAYAQTSEQFIQWVSISIAFSTALPFGVIVGLLRLGKLSDLHIAVKEQRPGVLIFGLVSALCGTFILYRIRAPKAIVWLGIAYVLNGVVFLAVTTIWKISFHTGVASGTIMALALVVETELVFLFLLLPLIAWARIHRGRHTFVQTLAGSGLAILVTSVVLWHF
jgi:hypothetical protein